MGARFEPAGTLRFHPTRSGRWPGHWNTLAKTHRRVDCSRQACFRLNAYERKTGDIQKRNSVGNI